MSSSSSSSRSTLEKMMDAACNNKHGVKWSHVLHYLKDNCQVRDDEDEEEHEEQELPYPSPLQAYYVASPSLQTELKDGRVLRTALRTDAPSKIIAALCHLSPQSVTACDDYDSEKRIPLHVACRYPVTSNLETAMEILVRYAPLESLMHRDDKGRTPLHYLCSYHAADRSPQSMALFCQSLDKSDFYQALPPDVPKPHVSNSSNNNSNSNSNSNKVNAAMICDAIHGCWPLHYAVMTGVRAETVAVLYQAYPAAKHSPDRTGGRTPLHWYMGALDFSNHHPTAVTGEKLDLLFPYNNNNKKNRRRRRQDQETEEDEDEDPCSSSPALSPYHHRKIDPDILAMISSSRVARTADATKRFPLHWAVTFLAHTYMMYDYNNNDSNSSKDSSAATTKYAHYYMPLSVIQKLMDCHVGQLSCRDQNGMTPIMVLLDVVGKIQQRQWQLVNENNNNNNNKTRSSSSSSSRTTSSSGGFDPSLELIQMLLKQHNSSNNIAALEDCSGRLPLHAALEVAASAETIRYIVQQHPTGLIHTTEEEDDDGEIGGTMRVPLHAAFAHEWTAPWQTAETVNILLDTYEAGKYGSVIDGRLAMKMEDAAGCYPIHYACHNDASVSVIETLVERYPNTCVLQKPNGDLPVHCLLTPELLQAAVLVNVASSVNRRGSKERNEQLVSVARQKMQVLLRPLLSDPDKLKVADSIRGMLSLHIAVLFDAADYPVLLRMLELHPYSAVQFTRNLLLHESPEASPTNDSSSSFSPLDLHELRKDRQQLSGKDLEEWHHIRELLFSFSPMLESHRHRGDLLDRCVRIVVDEVSSGGNGAGSYHLRALRETQDDPPDLELTHTVSEMAMTTLRQFRRRSSRKQKVSNQLAPNKSRHHPDTRTTPVVPSGVSSPTESPHEQAIVKTSSSKYDDEDLGFNYDPNSFDNSDEESVEGTEASHSVGSREDSFCGTEDHEMGTYGDESEMGFESLLYNTLTGSRLRTTFEEQSSNGNSDDSHTFDDGSTYRTQGRSFDDSTLLSRRRRSFDYDNDDSTTFSAGSLFEEAKRRAEEEKKDDESSFRAQSRGKRSSSTVNKKTNRKRKAVYQRPAYLSEVAMRLWTFFVLYCDPNNPSDCYVKQLLDIVEELDFATIGLLVSNALPPYASDYFEKKQNLEGLCFRDIASPKCRELIHKTCYFLGRYEFPNDDNLLVRRGCTGASIVIKANEWLFTTEEATNARETGMSEKNIWTKGEVLAEVGVTFKTSKRPVWIKLTKDAMEYHNEVQIRVKLGVPVDDEEEKPQIVNGIVPLLQHYNAFATDRKMDRTYNADIRDERFKSVTLFAGATSDKRAVLDEYPYALVYPTSPCGTLDNYFLQNGVDSSESKAIVLEVADALKALHEKGLVHKNVSMRTIAMKSTERNAPNRWSLMELSSCSERFTDEAQDFLGGINSQGLAQFSTETLPPEMFAKLSPAELRTYSSYWLTVKKRFQIQINNSVIDPMVDLKTGATYVVKCHFLPLTNSAHNDVPLPYDLVPTDEGTDIWALGQLLFCLCTGRTLFHAGARNGHLVDYAAAFNWDAAPTVYEHVGDSLTQDILLTLLSPSPVRATTRLEHLLQHHPFFIEKSGHSALAKKIIEKRRLETACHKRSMSRKLHESSEKEWLRGRSVTIQVWDFDLLKRISLAPSQIVRGMLSRKMDFFIPCSLVLLPFDMFSRISTGVVKSAERIGETLLELSKTCYFASMVRKATLSHNGSEFNKLSSSKISSILGLSSEDFGCVQSQMADLAAKHVYLRHDPVKVTLKLVQEKIKKFLACFEDERAFLYLFDEYTCSPVADESLPFLVPDDWRDRVLQSGLVFMLLCSLYSRGVSRGVAGLLKMLYPTNEITSVPSSWIEASKGLIYELDEHAMIDELNALQDALADMNASSRHSIRDDTITIHDFLAEVDTKRNVGGMLVVFAADACLWTTADSTNMLEESSRRFSVTEALRILKR